MSKEMQVVSKHMQHGYTQRTVNGLRAHVSVASWSLRLYAAVNVSCLRLVASNTLAASLPKSYEVVTDELPSRCVKLSTAASVLKL